MTGPSAALNIGEVLARLRPEFPDISPSKIRFLEAEGLIEPARSRSGYRQFALADVERLRYILTAQRDEYLPLRVIKERLDALDGDDRGTRQTLATALGAAVAADEAARQPGAPEPAGTAMTRAELLEAAGIDAGQLAELEDYGLIRRSGRHYGADALEVARACAALAKFGVEARNLRGIKAAAERDVSLVEQLVSPQLRQRGAGSRAAAAQDAWQIATLSLWLHAALVESGLGEAGLAGGVIVPPAAAPAPRAGDVGGGLRSASSR
ncbi:MAG TPA: MerR family transcriptional regulator [Streptosporangiaceae bacterium]|jgi:DNA-binding transcriptional MerR regulator|nr:MerR family transcriptional regulator [Streptosporangiaceae bacterium]